MGPVDPKPGQPVLLGAADGRPGGRPVGGAGIDALGPQMLWSWAASFST
jgi:hypothetical protein